MYTYKQKLLWKLGNGIHRLSSVLSLWGLRTDSFQKCVGADSLTPPEADGKSGWGGGGGDRQGKAETKRGFLGHFAQCWVT